MTDRESLQQRLEEFRAAGRNLQLDPLVTQKALAQFGVEYQTELVDELEQAIKDCAEQDNKLVLLDIEAVANLLYWQSCAFGSRRVGAILW
jgi:hypothetical protein